MAIPFFPNNLLSIIDFQEDGLQGEGALFLRDFFYFFLGKNIT